MTDSLTQLTRAVGHLREVIKLSNSTLGEYSKCPARYKYRYVDKIAPASKNFTKVTIPQLRGTLMHAIIEQWYLKRPTMRELFDMIDAYEFDVDPNHVTAEDEVIKDWCKAAIQAYVYYYMELDTGANEFKVVDTEKTYALEIDHKGASFVLQGQIDLIVETKYGIVAVDHKTARYKPDRELFTLNPQGFLYLFLLYQNGYKPDKFIWNYIITTQFNRIEFNQNGSLKKSIKNLEYTYAYSTLKDKSLLTSNPEVKEKMFELAQVRAHLPSTAGHTPYFFRGQIEPSYDDVMRYMDNYIDRAAQVAKLTEQRELYATPGYSCGDCDYSSICEAKFYGHDVNRVLLNKFKQADPYAYYEKGITE